MTFWLVVITILVAAICGYFAACVWLDEQEKDE